MSRFENWLIEWAPLSLSSELCLTKVPAISSLFFYSRKILQASFWWAPTHAPRKFATISRFFLTKIHTPFFFDLKLMLNESLQVPVTSRFFFKFKEKSSSQFSVSLKFLTHAPRKCATPGNIYIRLRIYIYNFVFLGETNPFAKPFLFMPKLCGFGAE